MSDKERKGRLPPSAPPTPSFMTRLRTWSQGESSEHSQESSTGRRFFGSLPSPFTKRSQGTTPPQTPPPGKTTRFSLRRRSTSESASQSSLKDVSDKPRVRRASSGSLFFKWVDSPKSSTPDDQFLNDHDSKAQKKTKPIAPNNLFHYFTASEVQDAHVVFERVGTTTGASNQDNSSRVIGIVGGSRSTKAIHSGEGLVELLKAPVEYSKLQMAENIFQSACELLPEKEKSTTGHLEYVQVMMLLTVIRDRVGEGCHEMLCALLLRALGMDEDGYILQKEVRGHLLDLFRLITTAKARKRSDYAFEELCTEYKRGIGERLPVKTWENEPDIHEKTYVRIRVFFSQYYPDKLTNLSKLMGKHIGKEEKLIQKLEKQFQARIPPFTTAVEQLLNENIAESTITALLDSLFSGSAKVKAQALCRKAASEVPENDFQLLGNRMRREELEQIASLPRTFWQTKSLSKVFQRLPVLSPRQWKSVISIGCWMRFCSKPKPESAEGNLLKISDMRFIRRFALIRLHRTQRSRDQVAKLELYDACPTVGSNSSPISSLTLDGTTSVRRVYRPSHKHPYTIELAGESSDRVLILQPSSKSGKLRRRGREDDEALEAKELVNEWLFALRLSTQRSVMNKIVTDSSTWSRGKRSLKKVIRTLKRSHSGSGLFGKGPGLAKQPQGDAVKEYPRQDYMKRLEVFFQREEPGKLKEIPSMLSKYQGREELLVQKLEKQYGTKVLDLDDDGSDSGSYSEGGGSESEWESSYDRDPQDGSEVQTENDSGEEGSMISGGSTTGEFDEEQDNTKARLVAFYKKHNPSKLDQVPKILQNYSGREDVLFAKLNKQYGLTDS